MNNFTPIILIFAASACIHLCAHEPDQSAPTPDYFNTSFLTKYDQVKRSLKDEHFADITFTSTDGLRLEGLYLKRPGARYNVICCAGWRPGRKEGIATFYKLLPDDCNILFFDARGHGKSEGGTCWRVDYGLVEYKDIIGALEIVHKDTNKPTIIYGVCSGAFNAAHALLELHKQHRLQALQVIGLIFDSGWVSVDATSYSVAVSKTNEALMKNVASWYLLPNYKDAQQTKLFSCCSSVVRVCIGGLHCMLRPFFSYYDMNTNLLRKIEHTPLPVPSLFIHSHDDTCVSLADVQKFAACVPQSSCWWIDKPSKHACHHLKHKDEYQQKLQAFVTECTQPSLKASDFAKASSDRLAGTARDL